jgi:hypothetical protein
VGSGAGFVRIDSVSSMDEKAVQAQAAQIQMRVLNNPRTAGQGLQEWFAARRKAAKIENNLDQFYRD